MNFKILNEDLLSPEEQEKARLVFKINRLQQQIEAFKKYDEERKQYYSKILTRLGQAESYVEELEYIIKDLKAEKFVIKLNEYKKQLAALNNRLVVYRALDLPDEKFKELCADICLAKNYKKSFPRKQNIIQLKSYAEKLEEKLALYQEKFGEL